MATKKVARPSTAGNGGQGRGRKASSTGRKPELATPTRRAASSDPEWEAERLLQQVAAETDEHLQVFRSKPVDRVLDREARRLDAAAAAGTSSSSRGPKKNRAPDRRGRERGKGATPRRARRA